MRFFRRKYNVGFYFPQTCTDGHENAEIKPPTRYARRNNRSTEGR